MSVNKSFYTIQNNTNLFEMQLALTIVLESAYKLFYFTYCSNFTYKKNKFFNVLLFNETEFNKQIQRQ